MKSEVVQFSAQVSFNNKSATQDYSNSHELLEKAITVP